MVFDLKTYAVLGSLAAMPDADGIIFDPTSGYVLVVSGRGKALMSFKPDIDPKNGKIDEPIALHGEPEFLAADPSGKVYINLMDTHEVAVVDFKARGKKITIEGKNIGYELRCAPPIPFDVEYTRDLGYGAVEYLKKLADGGDGELGAMITLQEDRVVPLPFGSFSDPETGKVRIREVDVASTSYRVAREYMIRLDRQDLEDDGRLKAMAQAAGLDPEAFRDRYGYLAKE